MWEYILVGGGILLVVLAIIATILYFTGFFNKKTDDSTKTKATTAPIKNDVAQSLISLLNSPTTKPPTTLPPTTLPPTTLPPTTLPPTTLPPTTLPPTTLPPTTLPPTTLPPTTLPPTTKPPPPFASKVSDLKACTAIVDDTPFCVGKGDGCDWDGTISKDCTIFNTTSPRYTDGKTCTELSQGRFDAGQMKQDHWSFKACGISAPGQCNKILGICAEPLSYPKGCKCY